MTNILKTLGDLALYVKWGNISRDYFGFSRAWIYQRLNGYDGNGNHCEFTEAQRETLKEALNDLAGKLKTAAEEL